MGNRKKIKRSRQKAQEPFQLLRFWQDLNPILRFFLLFGVTMLAFYTVYMQDWFKNGPYDSYGAWSVQVAAAILQFFGQDVAAEGRNLTGAFPLTVNRGCDALEPIAIYLTAVFAYPATWSNKLKGIFVGISLLVFVNILRIITLYWVGLHFESFFDLMHISVWQVLFMGITVATCMWWINSTFPNLAKPVP